MKWIEQFVSVGNDILWTYILIAALLGLGLYFTFRSNFVQFRMLKEMIRLLGEGAKASPGKKGVSSFQAFCISTASRVGTGNLAGVALAIALGGPGAVFWMWMIALVGAASGFVESTLAQIYKERHGDTFRGGPAYYMEKALGKRWMGLLFSLLMTLCFGLIFNSVQANTISLAFHNAFGVDRLFMGLILAVLMAIVIFGGVKRIARVAQVIVPVMAVIYILVALFIMVTHFRQIPEVFALIVQSAFQLEAAVGGGLGAALMEGIRRGLFSNEAGMGSAPNAAATADVSHPVKQGLIQTLGVFTDTLLICSATAFIILFAGDWNSGLVGIELTQAALATTIGPWAPSFIAVVIFLFAFSSLLGNYYYGETNIQFIRANPVWLRLYQAAFFGLLLFGAVQEIDLVWNMADLFMASMTLVNLIAIALLGKIAFAALQDYIRQKKEGKDPVFTKNSIPGLKNVECWDEKPEAEKKAQ
ncbi:alanine/glycine:cation symporter family protein [Desmospora profundinema]|uniref:AGCS family alanine or glycine:cation symporter n=1 Tax=Desmospora profundinema TaxID=1571184 RepID=A0ABU1IQ10_9BACL|nr:alanine/glycine:cation symporter family protein [Desmospora profundinema]MDR6226892.1 AGCS family alanine or glycine:cation symporter [Desmospora profundinema]